MGAKLEREQLRGLVEPHWRRLYNFMFRLTLDRERAERYLADLFALAADNIATRPASDTETEVWLLGLANQMLEERLPDFLFWKVLCKVDAENLRAERARDRPDFHRYSTLMFAPRITDP